MDRKKIGVFVISLFFIIEFGPSISGFTYKDSNIIIYVNGNNKDGPWQGTIEHPYEKIEDGIKFAADSNTVYVFPYVYNESVVIRKNITLQGAEKNTTVLTYVNNSPIRIINVEVEICNFTLISNYNVIWVDHCNNNSIHDNIVNCSNRGFNIYYSTSAEIRNNYFEKGGIAFVGNSIEHFNSHTIENNSVNGKPIRYYKNVNEINIPEETGQVILANCDLCKIKDLTLSNSGVAIQISYSNNNIIKNNDLIDNADAIVLYRSSDNNIIDNNLLTQGGITLTYSENNNISYNEIVNSGISIYESNHNSIYNNTICKGGFGIFSLSCNNLVIRKNKIYGHNSTLMSSGIFLAGDGIQIDHNDIFNNECGIALLGTSLLNRDYIRNNEIFENNCGISLNGIGIIVENNNIINNIDPSIHLSFTFLVNIRQNNIVSSSNTLLRATSTFALAQNNYWGTESIFPPKNRMIKISSFVLCFPSSANEFSI